MGKKFYLRLRDDLDDKTLKVDLKNAKSKELKETFKKKDKAGRLPESQVLQLLKGSFLNLIDDIYRNRGNEYFDTLFNNIAFAKYFPDMVEKYSTCRDVEKCFDNIMDTIAKYYDPRLEERDNSSEKLRYINKKYKNFLKDNCWDKLRIAKDMIPNEEERFNLVIQTFNIRNATNVYCDLYNLTGKKAVKTYKYLLALIDEDEERIIGELLSTRKRIPDDIAEKLYREFSALDDYEMYEALLYYAKREKPTLARDISRQRVKTQLVIYLENYTSSKIVKKIMKFIVNEDVTLVDTFDYILKNENLFKGERLYPFSAIKNKGKIERDIK